MYRKNNLLLLHGSQKYQRIRMKIIGVTRDGKPRFYKVLGFEAFRFLGF